MRATGSGMGCPDWPKCFGQWVPPTAASQLPAGYQQVYLAQRVAKNQKLARTLASLGFRQVAGEIFAHPTQYIETEFNATKTWIEYLNRLLGALIGIFRIRDGRAVALPYWRRDRPVLGLAVAGWLLTGVQGWLGSLVVSTNLLPVMVTIHMGLALLIVALLLSAAHRARYGRSAGGLRSAKRRRAATLGQPANATVAGFGRLALATGRGLAAHVLADSAGYPGAGGNRPPRLGGGLRAPRGLGSAVGWRV